MSADIEQNEKQTEMVLVPRHPTKEMIDEAYYDALAEDAGAVWKTMIEVWLKQGKLGER